MVLRPTRSTRTVTLFPYTTLCRAPELEDILRIAMPDVEWCEWEPRHLKGASAPKIKKVVKRIVAYLQALPPETLKISSRALKKEVEPDASERIWRDAVKSAAGTLEDWRQKGRPARKRGRRGRG